MNGSVVSFYRGEIIRVTYYKNLNHYVAKIDDNKIVFYSRNEDIVLKKAQDFIDHRKQAIF